MSKIHVEKDERLMLWTLPDAYIRFFRQAGGCLEIAQDDDLVHICSGQIKDVLDQLQKFVNETEGMNHTYRCVKPGENNDDFCWLTVGHDGQCKYTVEWKSEVSNG